MSTTTTFKPRAALGTERTETAKVLSRAAIMYAAILLAIASFPNLPVTMAAFKVLYDALVSAEGAAKARTKGLATVRNTKREALWGAMELTSVYVQILGDQLPVEGSKALIESAGLLVALANQYVKPILQAKPTITPGVVDLIANASLLKGNTSKNTTFHWQWSANGKDWVSVPSTPKARTQITGLTVPGTSWFRAAVTIGTDVHDWTAAVSIQLH